MVDPHCDWLQLHHGPVLFKLFETDFNEDGEKHVFVSLWAKDNLNKGEPIDFEVCGGMVEKKFGEETRKQLLRSNVMTKSLKHLILER